MDLKTMAGLPGPFVGGGLKYERPQETAVYRNTCLYYVQDINAIKKWGAKKFKRESGAADLGNICSLP